MPDTMMDENPFKIPPHVPPELVVDIDIYRLPHVASGFHEAWLDVAKMRDGDFVWTPHNGGHWICTRGSLINKIYSDYKRFSSRNHLVPTSEFGEVDSLPVTTDPPANVPYRNLMNGSLSPQAVMRIEGKIRELASSIVERVKPNGGCEFLTECAELYPVNIFLMLMDLPQEDAEKLKNLNALITRPADMSLVPESIRGVQAYLEPWIAARRGGTGVDLLSHMVNGMIGDRMITLEEVKSMTFQVLGAGLDTVVNWVCFVMMHLARDPDSRRQLAENPALIPRAVNEFLRRFPVATLARQVADDLTYEGVTFKKDDMIALPTMLHGLDARANIDPMKVDFHREAPEHTSFGEGGHKCPGSNLARLELKILIEEWLKRIPDFELAPEASITFGGGIVGYMDQLPLVWAT